jgi:UDP-glucose 4-epimerase
MTSMTDRQTVLVTGGAGFIGSHTCVELLQHGHDVVVVDDCSNSSSVALERVEELASCPVTAYEADLRDARTLDEVFSRHRFDAVIHFAAKKAVGESVEIPLEYYDVNVGATVGLLKAMRAHGVDRLVFSSSCSVYGQAEQMPIVETTPAAPTNPYARSKWMCEQVLADAAARYDELRIVALRYFNPVGAHESGLLGEDPRGVPNNVMPFLAQVAVGRLPRLRVFGADYPTRDGSGVRDYIHVMDVADGHREALAHLDASPAFRVLNLGTGVGTSVLELRDAFQAASGREIPVELTDRRPGDVAELVADPAAVEREWGWRTTRDVAAMCRDAWAFQQRNPDGYGA